MNSYCVNSKTEINKGNLNTKFAGKDVNINKKINVARMTAGEKQVAANLVQPLSSNIRKNIELYQ